MGQPALQPAYSMPISAYFYRAVHLAPEDALQAAEDLGCDAFIPWGYGTFILGHEHVLEPLRRLEEAQRRMQPSFPLHVLKMGETWVLEETFKKYSAQSQP
jgi:L-ascorbate metabolism protein UlaG (beta-lactamase superfamily)